MVARRRIQTRLSARALAIIAVAVLLAGAAWYRHAVVSRTPRGPNYDDGSAWLCRPGRDDPCTKPTTVTVFETATRKSVKTFKPDASAPIDCFYVYPTVSKAPGINAPIAAGDEEVGIVRDQFAPFASVCRPFAPLYRQITRAGLKQMFKGKAEAERQIAYGDVLAAWKSYMSKDNSGRGFVLIGHSQGARILARLMAEEIDSKPIEAKLVSAIVVGTQVEVPDGKRIGGTYQHIPLCEAKSQTGCVIAYSSYPAAKAMPEDAFFGSTKTPGMRYACVSPMTLAGTTSIGADLPVEGDMRKTLGTDFRELPGLIAAQCRRDARFDVLAVGAAPGSDVAAKTEEMIGGVSHLTWGLHSLDLDIALGTLIDIVRAQSTAYSKR